MSISTITRCQRLLGCLAIRVGLQKADLAVAYHARGILRCSMISRECTYDRCTFTNFKLFPLLLSTVPVELARTPAGNMATTRPNSFADEYRLRYDDCHTLCHLTTPKAMIYA